MSKWGVSKCSYCKISLEEDAIQSPLRKESQTFEKHVKGPIWQFAGLIGILRMSIWGYFSSIETEKLELQYISSPKKGDVYEYKVEAGEYSSLGSTLNVVGNASLAKCF